MTTNAKIAVNEDVALSIDKIPLNIIINSGRRKRESRKVEN